MRFALLTMAALALCASSPRRARAYEDQATLGASIGYAGLPESEGLPQNGIDVTLSAGRGLGDAWSLQGLLGYALLVDERPLHLGRAGLETVYALDIVRFVPLIGFGLDGFLSVRERNTHGDFALHALLGFDFLIDRRWSVGVDARGFWVATHAKSPLGPFFVTVGLRLGVRFDLR